MRRSPPGLAFARRHEVAGGGDVVHREGQGATAPAVLGGAEEPLFLRPPGTLLARSGGWRRIRCGRDRAWLRWRWRRSPSFILAVWLPSAATSSTTRAHAAFSGCPALAGRRAAVTRMWVEPGATGGVWGAALSRLRRGPSFPRLAIPEAIQWRWKRAHAPFPGAGLGWPWMTCLALSCSYRTWPATRWRMAQSTVSSRRAAPPPAGGAVATRTGDTGLRHGFRVMPRTSHVTSATRTRETTHVRRDQRYVHQRSGSGALAPSLRRAWRPSRRCAPLPL